MEYYSKLNKQGPQGRALNKQMSIAELHWALNHIVMQWQVALISHAKLAVTTKNTKFSFCSPQAFFKKYIMHVKSEEVEVLVMTYSLA